VLYTNSTGVIEELKSAKTGSVVGFFIYVMSDFSYKERVDSGLGGVGRL
jgi:hypothetical protein